MEFDKLTNSEITNELKSIEEILYYCNFLGKEICAQHTIKIIVELRKNLREEESRRRKHDYINFNPKHVP